MIDITRLDSGVYDFDAEPLDLEAAVLALPSMPSGRSPKVLRR